MVFSVALLGGDARGRSTLADALTRALASQAPDAAVSFDATSAPGGPGRFDLTLLLAPTLLDDPLCEAADVRLREALHSAGTDFQVVHGWGAERVQQALRALGSTMGRALVADDPALTRGRGPWRCENCSDPDCERRMFTGLTAQP